MVESSNEFSLFLAYQDITFGVSLSKKIKYDQLVEYAKKKFKFNDTCDLMFAYQVGTRCVHIVDDDDVNFYVKKICGTKGTEHTLLVKLIDKCLNSIPSSSKSKNFDLNVPLFSNNSNSIPSSSNTSSFDLNVSLFPKIEPDENLWQKNTLKFIPNPPNPQPIIKTTPNMSLHAARVLKKGQRFDSKAELKYEIGLKAVLDGYEFKARKTDTTRYDVICRNDDCNWKIISSKCKGSTKWQIGTINDHHTCPKTQLGMNHRNVTAKFLARLIESKFKDENRVYRGKDIKNNILTDWNIDITYKKAWRAKNLALESLSGCPVASFAQLPYYCHNLKMKNDGTLTHIETDNQDRFKMVFIGFGPVIRSFKNHMRPLIIIDAAHLKGRFEGTNLVAVGMDGNNQIIPIATGVSQGENGPSWTLFLSKLKECIGDVPNLGIISDRHAAIKMAVQAIFPNAFHGYCCRHLMMNCKLTGISLRGLFWKMCKTYSHEEFNMSLNELRHVRPDAYTKLIEAGVEKWSRAYCPYHRYNYMTSNSAESINNLTRNVRALPVTNLMEWYRGLVQKWYLDKREKYKDAKLNELSDWATAKITKRLHKSVNWIVTGIDMHRVYEVDDRRAKHTVEFYTGTCTCRKWQLSGFPCGHVLAASKSFGVTDYSHLAKGWFRTTVLKSTYQELIYPLGEVSSWEHPNYLQVVHPPLMTTNQSGRPKGKARIRSQGEEPSPTRCGRCGARGHNRNSCREAIAQGNNNSQMEQGNYNYHTGQDHYQQQGNYNYHTGQDHYQEQGNYNYNSQSQQHHYYQHQQNYNWQQDHYYSQQDNYNTQQANYNSQPFSWEPVNLNEP